MRRSIKLAVGAALALSATSALATNGSNLMGIGAKSRGMGGVTIGIAHGAESGLSNAALITSVKGTEVSFGGTIFMPNVSNENGLQLPVFGDGPGTNPTGGVDDSSNADSDANMNVIPEVSISSKINDNFYWGIGMWGTAGMGVDYRDAANTGQMSMVTNLQLMQFGVPLAYTTNGFSIGITPILQYGSLDINYVMSGNLQHAMSGGQAPSETPATTVGSGVAQDLQFGFNIGLAYQIADFTIGAIYKSQIDMEYEGVLSGAAAPMSRGAYTNDKLSTPAEIGLGASYEFSGNTVALDYKQIKWSSAKGYEDFEWEDQSVIAIGYEYATTGWAARVGYNYASSPISEQTVVNPQTDMPNSSGLTPGVVNTSNLLGFPAIIESHMTIGGSYTISETTTVDLAYAYAPEVSNTYKNFMGQDIKTTHSQTSLSFQLNYNF
jgi:long-chain fatty acid transport protein